MRALKNMKLKLLKLFGICFVLIISYVAWACIPPYPKPNNLIGHTHNAIEKQLGKPSIVFPDKFIRWESNRGLFIWDLDTDSPLLLIPANETCSTERTLTLWTPLGHYPIQREHSENKRVSYCNF